MELTLKLAAGATLRDAALEVQQLNLLLADQLVNGPIPCDPDSDTPEGYLGDCNTPPNEFGYVTVAIAAYRKLILPSGLAPSTFSIVLGEPVEEVVGEDGTVQEVRGGALV